MAFEKIGNLSLSMPYGSLLNCLGIQPVFHADYYIPTSFLGFVYRMATQDNKKGQMKYLMKFRLGEENKEIIDNKFHISEAPKKVIDTIMANSFTLKHNTPLNVLLNDDDLLKETIYYYLKRIELYTSLGCGNFVITSNQDLYYKKFFTSNEISNFNIYLVKDSLLPRNILLLGHKSSNSFGNPYVASPLIDKKHFDEICSMNGINIKDFPYRMNKRYPMIDRQLNLYSLYQSYLDNVQVPYWYIETFRNPTKTRQKAYYTTLFFD